MIGLRATPLSIAALATADGIAQIRRGSNGTGMMIVGAVFEAPPAIGRGDLVGHVLAREGGERLGGRDLHLVIDRRGAHIERAAEDIGKAQDIVDLVRIVRTAGRDDRVGPHGLAPLRA